MTNHPNRSRRIWEADGAVFLRDVDYMGDEVIRQFWVPPGGGYVRELESGKPGTLSPQACERLSNRGNTLHSSREGLLSLIRAEYRRRVAAERRERDRF